MTTTIESRTMWLCLLASKNSRVSEEKFVVEQIDEFFSENEFSAFSDDETFGLIKFFSFAKEVSAKFIRKALKSRNEEIVGALLKMIEEHPSKCYRELCNYDIEDDDLFVDEQFRIIHRKTGDIRYQCEMPECPEDLWLEHVERVFAGEFNKSEDASIDFVNDFDMLVKANNNRKYRSAELQDRIIDWAMNHSEIQSSISRVKTEFSDRFITAKTIEYFVDYFERHKRNILRKLSDKQIKNIMTSPFLTKEHHDKLYKSCAHHFDDKEYTYVCIAFVQSKFTDLETFMKLWKRRSIDRKYLVTSPACPANFRLKYQAEQIIAI